jgi:neutral ceramidase
MTDSLLRAGAAKVEITPDRPMHLHGYPHVKRVSTGVHDPLFSSALYLESAGNRAIFIANDIVYVSKASTQRCRDVISLRTGMPRGNIMISATHTHSGPKALDSIATEADPAVPKTDPAYVRFMEEKIVDAACRAIAAAQPAEAGLAVGDATGVGTNRRDPNGANDLAVPVLVVRSIESRKPIAVMLVCSMHPTVLHEDSTLISGDFPAMARQKLCRDMLGETCIVLYHTGPAGNQSPRHVTKSNTFAEAERLGAILGEAAAKVIPSINYRRDLLIHCRSTSAPLPMRVFPPENEAHEKLDRAVTRLRELKESNAPRVDVRTAEVDWFGAEETLSLSRAAASGRLQTVADAAMPAEVQAISIGDWNFIAWPGEQFVEFALDVKSRAKNTFLISYANGELQGYLVTKQAADEGGYESLNAIFRSPEGGELLVKMTLDLLQTA